MPAVTYRTKDGTKEGFVPGVGPIVDGRITVPEGTVLENANLERIEDQPQPQPHPQAAPAASVASPSVASSPAPVPVAQPVPHNEQPVNKDNV